MKDITSILNNDLNKIQISEVAKQKPIVGVLQEKYERMRIIAAIAGEYDITCNAEDFIRTDTGYRIPQRDGSTFIITYQPADHHIGPQPFTVEKK